MPQKVLLSLNSSVLNRADLGETPKSKATNRLQKATEGFAGETLSVDAPERIGRPASDPVEITNALNRTEDVKAAQRTLTQVSDSASFISIAQQAVAKEEAILEDVLTRLRAGETSLAAEDTYAADQASDIESELAKIDNIPAEAEFIDGESVVNRGVQNFGTDLDGSEDSSDSLFRLSVGNIGISSSDLGLDDITAESIQADPEAAAETVEDALNTVRTVGVQLQSAADQINDFASEEGLQSLVRSENADFDEELNSLVDSVVQAISTSPKSIFNNVSTEPQGVDELLAPVEDSTEEEDANAIVPRTQQESNNAEEAVRQAPKEDESLVTEPA